MIHSVIMDEEIKKGTCVRLSYTLFCYGAVKTLKSFKSICITVYHRTADIGTNQAGVSDFDLTR